jgi:hypothetical protein
LEGRGRGGAPGGGGSGFLDLASGSENGPVSEVGDDDSESVVYQVGRPDDAQDLFHLVRRAVERRTDPRTGVSLAFSLWLGAQVWGADFWVDVTPIGISAPDHFDLDALADPVEMGLRSVISTERDRRIREDNERGLPRLDRGVWVRVLEPVAWPEVDDDGVAVRVEVHRARVPLLSQVWAWRMEDVVRWGDRALEALWTFFVTDPQAEGLYVRGARQVLSQATENNPAFGSALAGPWVMARLRMEAILVAAWRASGDRAIADYWAHTIGTFGPWSAPDA